MEQTATITQDSSNPPLRGRPRSGSGVQTPDSDDVVIAPATRLNPFMSPYASQPNSNRGSTTALSSIGINSVNHRYFHSRKIKRGELERPWLDKKDPREKWIWIIPCIGFLVGLGIAGFLIWNGIRSVVVHEYCQVLDEDWSHGFDTKIWTKEAEVGGYGNEEFEQTTIDDENVFLQDGSLIIKPTLQDAKLIESNNVINYTKMGICSSTVLSNCVTSTNTTNGTIVQPVKSGRINSKKGAKIKYGRVEVTATLPTGDWLWPAIWLLPMNNTYGSWPRSGEIDIMESRGNNLSYPEGGNNIMTSTLHWGPNTANDAYWRSNEKRKAKLTTYAKGPHTFGLEWSEDYIFTYVDSRIIQVLYFDFKGPLYARGRFPIADTNGTALLDSWSQTGRASTPFDQDFYLILNVAVGGTNGWFKDGAAGKPWVDGSDQVKNEFWNSRDQWYPTWKNGGQMKIDRVRMWQQKGYNGC